MTDQLYSQLGPFNIKKKMHFKSFLNRTFSLQKNKITLVFQLVNQQIHVPDWSLSFFGKITFFV